MSTRENPDPEHRSPLRRFGPVVVVALVVAVVGGYYLARPAEVVVAPGARAPEISLPLLGGGGRVTSSDLEGKILVLNFWGSFCPPCRDEAPILDRAHREYGDYGVVVLGIDVQRDSDAAALRFADEFGMTYRLLKDRGGELAATLEVNDRFLPQTFFVHRDGTFAEVEVAGLTTGNRTSFFGGLEWDELSEQLDSMLAAR
ncbi:MAG: redoxin domain-containing protein [Actinobacteria bacterium]|nr:redoxin domain-containing protein [Actinomycetota bacterium]